MQGEEKLMTQYWLVSFTSFIAEFAGLVLSLYSLLAFFMKGYQSFIVSKSMLKKLYGEVPDDESGDEGGGGGSLLNDTEKQGNQDS